MFEVDSSVKSSLPAKPSSATGFYALVRSSLLTESGFILFFFLNVIHFKAYIHSCSNFVVAQSLAYVPKLFRE